MCRVLRVLSLPTAVIVVTLGWLWLDRAMGWHGIYAPRTGAAFVAVGAALVLW